MYEIDHVIAHRRSINPEHIATILKSRILFLHLFNHLQKYEYKTLFWIERVIIAVIYRLNRCYHQNFVYLKRRFTYRGPSSTCNSIKSSIIFIIKEKSVVWVEPMLCVLGDSKFLGKRPYCWKKSAFPKHILSSLATSFVHKMSHSRESQVK